jgi:single-stranded DNA-binding protein
VIAVGTVHTSEYEDRDGVKRSSLEMRATAVGPDLARVIARIAQPGQPQSAQPLDAQPLDAQPLDAQSQNTPPVDAPGQSDPADGQVDGGDARADASGVEDAESEELVLGAPA